MNKKIISIIIAFLAVGCVSFIFSQQKIKLNNVENIAVIAKDENLNVIISAPDDIEAFRKILSKRPVSDSHSCPFGYAEIQVNQNNGSTVFFPATDSCHIIKTDDKYFHLSDSEWESLIQILEKYDIDRSLLESCKGI